MSGSNVFWIALGIVLGVNVLAWVIFNRLRHGRQSFFRSFIRSALMVLAELLVFILVAATAAFPVYLTSISGFYEEGEGLLTGMISGGDEMMLGSLTQARRILNSKETGDYLFYYADEEDGYRTSDYTGMVPGEVGVIYAHGWQPMEYYQPNDLPATLKDEEERTFFTQKAKDHTAQAQLYLQNEYQVPGEYRRLPAAVQKIIVWDSMTANSASDVIIDAEEFYERFQSYLEYRSFNVFQPEIPLARIIGDIMREQQTYGFCQKMILQKATAADFPATENNQTIDLENLTGLVKPYCIRAAGTTAVDALLEKGSYSESDVYYIFEEYTVRTRAMFLATLNIGKRIQQAAVIAGICLLVLFVVLVLQFREIERRLYKQQNDLFYAIAHELKTPMGVVMLHGEKVLESETAQDKDERTLGMLEEIKDMNQRLMDVLAQSKLEGGRYRMKRSSVSLLTLAREVADGYEPLADDKDIMIELTGEDLHLTADGYLMKYAISNYLSNAVKYTPQGGQIKIEVHQKKRSAVLTVWNAGSHIPQSSIGRIWDPFGKVSDGSDNAKQGSGLGLSIVRSIVSLHGGSCGAENRDGGVAFWCRFPMKKQKKQ